MALTTTTNNIESTFNHNGTASMRFKEGTAYSIEQTLIYGSNINWDTSLGQVAVVILSGSTANITAPTNMISGAFYNIEIRQDSTGGRLLVWNSVFKFANNLAPTLSSGGNARDYFTFKSDGVYLYEQGRSQGIVPTIINA